MSFDQASERRNVVIKLVAEQMKAGVDYGLIPGVQKPSLWKPGAEKLVNLFGLVASFEMLKSVEDWTGEAHGGEPFFYYKTKCKLWRGNMLMGEGEGSCNSWEVKYRWRKVERQCPECGCETIIKGKKEFGGGWLCWKKRGGCGATFKEGDSAIEEQSTDRKPNPDIFDQVNTFLKMANKRAKIDATINATSASEFFTQDLEDIAPFSQPKESQAEVMSRHTPPVAASSTTTTPATAEQSEAKSEEVPLIVQEAWQKMKSTKGCIETLQFIKSELIKAISEAGKSEYYRVLKFHGAEHANELKPQKARIVARDLLAILETARAMTDDEPKSAPVQTTRCVVCDGEVNGPEGTICGACQGDKYQQDGGGTSL
jgi:hypothetical protein